MLERDIQRACLEWLRAKGFFCWRQNQAAVPLAGGGFRKFNGLRGVSDILGILPQTVSVDGKQETFGNFLAIEVKQPGKKPTDEQEAFLKRVNELGGVGICVRALDELESELSPYL